MIIEVGEVFIHRNQDRERNRKIFCIYYYNFSFTNKMCVYMYRRALVYARARSAFLVSYFRDDG